MRASGPRRRDGEWGASVADESTEMVTIPRAELDALKAELRRLRLAEGDRIALARMKAHPAPDPAARRFSTAEELAEALGLRG